MKKELTADEFAINENAAYKVVASNSSLKVKPDGTATITITLNCSLEKPTTNLQVQPGEILFDRCGVFNKTKPDHFQSVTISNLYLDIESDKIIQLNSADGDVSLTTNGEKGNHGSSFLDGNPKVRQVEKRI